MVAAQNRIDQGRGNVVGQDFGDSAGFGVLLLNGAYRVSATLELSAGVDNLFDKDYAEHLNLAGDAGFGYPADPEAIDEPGRTLWPRSISTSEPTARRKAGFCLMASCILHVATSEPCILHRARCYLCFVSC